MEYAIIDLGSNTIRLLVYECNDKKLTSIISQKAIVGLAGYVTDGVMEQKGIEEACRVLLEFKELATKFVTVENIYLFATASLRNIFNRESATEQIYNITGMRPDVLDGEDEAFLSYQGASYGNKFHSGIVVDIGGASTEIVLIQNDKISLLKSLPIGCLSLYTKYVSNMLPSSQERKAMKQEVRRQLASLNCEEEQCQLLIGVGGSLRAVGKLSRSVFNLDKEQNVIEVETVKKLYKKMKEPGRNMLREIYKRIPERALTIIPGFIILHEMIKHFKCKEFMISKYGVREGYLLSRILKD